MMVRIVGLNPLNCTVSVAVETSPVHTDYISGVTEVYIDNKELMVHRFEETSFECSAYAVAVNGYRKVLMVKP